MANEQPPPESAGDWPEPDIEASLARLAERSTVLTADRITPVETPPKPAPGDVAGLIEHACRLLGAFAVGAGFGEASRSLAVETFRRQLGKFAALTRTEQAESGEGQRDWQRAYIVLEAQAREYQTARNNLFAENDRLRARVGALEEGARKVISRGEVSLSHAGFMEAWSELAALTADSDAKPQGGEVADAR